MHTSEWADDSPQSPINPHPSSMLAILHGSRATGDAHASSDWDIAVLLDHPLTWVERSTLREAFAAQLHTLPDSVDIADLSSDSPLLRYRAAMNGRLIEGDPLDFRKFQIRAWKDHLNNEKILDLRRRFVAKSLQ